MCSCVGLCEKNGKQSNLFYFVKSKMFVELGSVQQ